MADADDEGGIEEEQDFYDTVVENECFVSVWQRQECPGDFLRRDETVYARGVSVDSDTASVWLEFRTDIDGCVVELNDIRGVEMPVRHLTLCPSDVWSVREVKGMLRKHVDLCAYSTAELQAFNNSLGIQLFYERGWECWLGLIPAAENRTVALRREVIRDQSSAVFRSLRSRLGEQLAVYASQGTAHQTLMKNDLRDLRKLFILPDDCPLILAALQRALAGLTMSGFRPIVFCFRFGEKMGRGLSLGEFRREAVAKVTVHAAVNIACDCDISLLWSMSGIQEVVGNRGVLGTCLSFRDCGNFQSNLDGRLMDVRPELRRLCLFPEKLRFVQLYADVPHLRPKTRLHPVSGCVAGCLCLPRASADGFLRDAERYLSALENNCALLRTSVCRLEVVCEWPIDAARASSAACGTTTTTTTAATTTTATTTPTCGTVLATDVLDLSALHKLLAARAMLVPLPYPSMACVRAVGLWLTSELRRLLVELQGTGNVGGMWRALQLELACEKLLWGRPLCAKSNVYSVNLGPGLLFPSRSLSDERGFLCLDAWTSCMSTEDSIPAYGLWTSSTAVGRRIERAAGIHDHVNGSACVLGRRLLLALLRDLHEVGRANAAFRFEDFLLELKSAEPRVQVVGAVSERSLVQLLATKRRTSVDMVFGSLCHLLEESGRSLAEVIAAGLGELGLRRFPALQSYDDHGNATLKWTFKLTSFWAVVLSSSSADAEVSGTPTSTELYCDLTRGELERRGVIFPSKLKKLPRTLPWVPFCLRKLRGRGTSLSRECTVMTLSFVSCIAFMMHGWFVEFDRLVDLMRDLPVTQSELKAMEILSKLELSNFKFRQLTLYRLHASIPHQFDVTASASTEHAHSSAVSADDRGMSLDSGAADDGYNVDPGDDDVVVGVERGVVRRGSTCVPLVPVTRLSWSGSELEILDNVCRTRVGESTRSMFEEYQRQCLKRNVPFRTFRAFESKLCRL